MSSTSLGNRGSDLPNLAKSESGSSYRWGTPPTGGSMPQAEAAALTRAETPSTDGREVWSVFQQSSSSSQTSSERPRLSASAGFEGLPPTTTLKTTSDPDILPNGSFPVRTCKGRINMRAHWASRGTYLVYHHPHRIYVGLLRKPTLVHPKH